MAVKLLDRLASLGYLVALLLLAGCQGCKPGLDGGPVNLEPDDPRPILSLEVADADEAGLLVQQLGLEVLRIEGNELFFFEDPALTARLEELGYDPSQQNSHEVFRRVVRIDRLVEENKLRTMGVQVINREEGFLIVDATIGQLRTLKNLGSLIATISGNEPRPRQIRIVVRESADVARIGAMEVDIYSAAPESRKPGDPDDPRKTYPQGPIVVYGAAFDYQIDRLEEAGYEVELLPEPPETTEKEKS